MERIKVRYPGFRVAAVVLMKAGTIQYDASCKEIIVNSTTEATLVPMTPFYTQRIGRTIEIVEFYK